MTLPSASSPPAHARAAFLWVAMDCWTCPTRCVPRAQSCQAVVVTRGDGAAGPRRGGARRRRHLAYGLGSGGQPEPGGVRGMRARVALPPRDLSARRGTPAVVCEL